MYLISLNIYDFTNFIITVVNNLRRRDATFLITCYTDRVDSRVLFILRLHFGFKRTYWWRGRTTRFQTEITFLPSVRLHDIFPLYISRERHRRIVNELRISFTFFAYTFIDLYTHTHTRAHSASIPLDFFQSLP